ncbi:MAG: ATP-binding cassette domain-containing protein [Candidatus Aenigmarchaeota archaeon]|nr:ATP-binding cassette domain-containing protein [Candidatus Aenigmarchaeota archaeon]
MAKIPVIKTVNLTKTFIIGNQEVKALNNVNIEIYSGELIIFFGPSGCGKSTLMSIVAGLQPPSSGDIFIRGENLADLDKNGLAKHRRTKIGIVFQAFNLINTMNVVENIALPLAFGGIGKGRRTNRALNLLEAVGMTEYKTHTPSELSGGQQQRIAIARALVANPWIVLTDEPTGNLDSKSANDIMRLLISLNRRSKRTVILITHNPDYLQYADRVIYLQDGQVIKIKVNTKSKATSMATEESVGKLKEEEGKGFSDFKPTAETKPSEPKEEIPKKAEEPKEKKGKKKAEIKEKEPQEIEEKKEPQEEKTEISEEESQKSEEEEEEKPKFKEGEGLRKIKL